MSWNTNGIKPKKDKLEHFIQEHNVDIILLNETHLRPSDNFNIINYKMYRKDRDQNGCTGCGVAVQVKNNIKHAPLQNTPSNNNIETIGVKIFTKNKRTFNIYSIYSPPNSEIDDAEIDLILKNNEPIIISEDLNAKNTLWNCKSTNVKGKRLEQYCTNRNIELIAPSEPTHYTTVGQSDILDLILTKNSQYDINLKVEKDLSSDHLPLLIEIYTTKIIIPRLIKITDWTKFREDLYIPNFNICNTFGLEAAITIFENRVTNTYNSSTVTDNKFPL